MTGPELDAWLAARGVAPPRCLSCLPDEWAPIIDRLITRLHEAAPGRWALGQVKSKFRQLRFYVDTIAGQASPEELVRIHAAVTRAEWEVDELVRAADLSRRAWP